LKEVWSIKDRLRRRQESDTGMGDSDGLMGLTLKGIGLMERLKVGGSLRLLREMFWKGNGIKILLLG
jgi:hypothetical protein